MPPLVEITLQTLKGISINTTTDTSFVRLPKVTAAVAFSGSADEMRVSSSFVCPKTGNLMVESHCANTLPLRNSNNNDNNDNTTQPLIAHWNQHRTGGLDVNDIHDDDVDPTHVSIYLPPRDPRLPSMPVSRSNRDSNIIKNVSGDDNYATPSIDESDVSSSTSQQQQDEEGGSVFWSQSEIIGAVMPEIVELNVSLKIDADSLHRQNQLHDSWSDDDDDSAHHADCIFPIGIAYLVLFGNDGGTTLMDLPIKRVLQQQSSLPPNILVADDASIRIRVNVYPEGRKPPTRRPRYNHAVTTAYSDKNVLQPILRQLQAVEDHRKAARLSRRAKAPTTRQPMFCGMMDIWKAVVACDDQTDGGILMASTSSMDDGSTLDTSPSMAFW